MFIWLKIISESFILAVKELWSSKLRSFLSLLGITIGIVCLITVFSAVDSLERNLRKSIDSFGGEVIYVTKYSWVMQEDYPFWKYAMRPNITRQDFAKLNGTVSSAEAIAIWGFANVGTIKRQSTYLEEINAFAITKDYDKVKDFPIEEGRYFNEAEFQFSQAKIIIGNDIAKELFGENTSAVGQEVNFSGVDFVVVGVLKREGQDVLGINGGFGLDNTVYLTDKYAATYLIDNAINQDVSILVKGKEGIPLDELEAELTGKMRMVRGLRPLDEADFSINRISIFTNLFDQMFVFIYMAGIVIGGFSIIVGGFGIANIMFVSVKERTSIIGIKKALGAKKIYILFEFIVEAILLCMIGAIIGLIIVFSLFQLIQIIFLADSDLQLIISRQNMTLGLAISVSTGLIAGIIPAIQAANMKPVEAIRS